MVRAICLDRLHDLVGSVAALEESLRLAQPGRYRRLYLDEGQPLLDLLGWLAHKPSLSPELRAYATQLLQRASDPHSRATNDHAHPANLKLVEPLTPRDLEVLALVRAGLSNREIAERLYLSLNTVKVHVKNIFGKLDVESRTQPVQRAEALGLL